VSRSAGTGASAGRPTKRWRRGETGTGPRPYGKSKQEPIVAEASRGRRCMMMRNEKKWYPTVLLEVAAATAACLVMMGILAITAFGVAGLLA
jgi:hypothetical protein